jgi:sulfur carrier protein ThiS
VKVHVEGAGFMRKRISPVDLDLPGGSTISVLSGALGIHDSPGVVFFRGGRRVSPSAALNDGDEIMVVSMLSGG